jgi:hypothetical protein
VPVLEATKNAAPLNNQVSVFQSTTAESLTTTVNKTLALATTTTNGIGVVNTAGSMVPPAGNYLLDYSVAFTDSVSEAFVFIMSPAKNGTAIILTGNQAVSRGTALGANEQVILSQSTFVSCNGTDEITLIALADGDAGVLTAGGVLRFVAI